MNDNQIAALVMSILLVGWCILARYSLGLALLLPAPLLVIYMIACLAMGVPA